MNNEGPQSNTRHIILLEDVNRTLKAGMHIWIDRQQAEMLIDSGKAEQFHASIFEYYIRKMNDII